VLGQFLEVIRPVRDDPSPLVLVKSRGKKPSVISSLPRPVGLRLIQFYGQVFSGEAAIQDSLAPEG
jgi:hypothetical protein